MCGITGYLGYRDAYPIIINGLRRLEYRGYDSAGIALLKDGENQIFKTKGKVSDLILIAKDYFKDAHIGLGHTRWATHGEPNNENSHPHISNSGNLVLVHNGIIENYGSIKKELISRGYTFESETDTEILVNLIEEVKRENKCNLSKAVQLALTSVVGAYAIAVYDKTQSNEIVVAKLGSPLVIGIGDKNKEFVIASDATPFIEYTKRAIYLEDGEMAIIQKDRDVSVRKIIDDSKIEPKVQNLKLSLSQIEKENYEHFMLKEIHEQPKAIEDTFRGRLLLDRNDINLGSLDKNLERFLDAKRIIIVACGTSWHAGLVGEYLIENLARLSVEVEYASEFRYRNPIINSDDIVMAISQSGETADTLAAIKLAKSKGAFVYGICNVVGSSIARETDAGSYTHAGPEIGVASTKAFTTQITLLLLIALKLGSKKKHLSKIKYETYLNEMSKIPKKISSLLDKNNHKIKEIAKIYKDATNFLYLGRGYNFPVALEGALKLKEISYIHAEGYPAAEMKHGPIALIDESMPVVVIATKKGHYEKIVSNIQEIKSRKGKIIAIVTKGDEIVREMADHVIEIQETQEEFTPILTTIPLQQLSYHIAVLRGCNVDQPRNLAKSVTVE